MRPSLKTIAKLLPPPASPRGSDRSWDAVEQELRLKLPHDYKAFIDLYGSGQIASAEGWVVVWNFRDASLFRSSLMEALSGDEGVTAWYRTKAASSGNQLPYPLYPDRGGLLPFAAVVDVDYLNWLTTGPTDQWNVVYWNFDGEEHRHLKGDTFGRCLLKMLRQQYTGLERPSSLKPPYEFKDLPR